MYVYMATGSPPLSLPVAVADTATELARMVGVKRSSIYEHISRKSRGERLTDRFIKVDIGDYREEDDVL